MRSFKNNLVPVVVFEESAGILFIKNFLRLHPFKKSEKEISNGFLCFVPWLHGWGLVTNPSYVFHQIPVFLKLACSIISETFLTKLKSKPDYEI